MLVAALDDPHAAFAPLSTGSESDGGVGYGLQTLPPPPPVAAVAGDAIAGSGGKAAGGKQEKIIRRGPTVMVVKPLPHVLLLHTGGTLGMDRENSFEKAPDGNLHLRKGTGGTYRGALQPGSMLADLFTMVPELGTVANLDLKVVFNRDSSRVGPKEWVQIARTLDQYRNAYDAFIVVHGTDTLSFTASALSLMLLGFGKPIVLTGSQMPLSSARSDARQNLIDAVTCAVAGHSPPYVNLAEVVVCFGGKLMRGNRSRKVHSSSYQAFDSPTYPLLAELGVDILWRQHRLLNVASQSYRPRFDFDPNVMRVPIVPGSDPRSCYGDLVDRGVKGIVLEAFGVGNMPDLQDLGWIPWLKQQTRKGLKVYMLSQCFGGGPLHPELYQSGSVALRMGVEAGAQMTPECACVKMMMHVACPFIPMATPLAGEL